MGLRISTAPHIRQGVTTRQIMGDVVVALLPCAIVGVARFGLPALTLMMVSVISAILAEYIWQRVFQKPVMVEDLSAVVTGLLLGLNLPPTAPWWLALIGSVIAIWLVKLLFGGIGDNFMNPAMAARAILLASWPAYMSSYVAPYHTMIPPADAVSTATPLATGGIPLYDLFMGDVPGTIGEISKLMILAGFAYLLIRRVISWRIPVTMLFTVMAASWALGADPLYAVLTGGVMFGAVFMATDYTTTPMTAWGQIIFAMGCGLIVVVIRQFSSYPEGVTYAILLMNIMTPLIDRWIKPKVYGKTAKRPITG